MQYVCAFVDPMPTCGVSGPVIRGENVTLSCSMTYYCKSPEAILAPGAGISASISWETEAGTFLSNSSTDETNSGGNVVGETLQVSVTTLASGSEIPSYNCTSVFQFTDRTSEFFEYALNSVNWTCTSPPVFTWCTYLSFIIFCKLAVRCLAPGNRWDDVILWHYNYLVLNHLCLLLLSVFYREMRVVQSAVLLL